eukprot:4617676-Ditylum_brightwellii.AAC.1
MKVLSGPDAQDNESNSNFGDSGLMDKMPTYNTAVEQISPFEAVCCSSSQMILVWKIRAML